MTLPLGSEERDPGMEDPYAAIDHTCEYCFLRDPNECYHRSLPNGKLTDIICNDCWEVFKRVNLWPIRRLNRIVKAARSPHATQPKPGPRSADGHASHCGYFLYGSPSNCDCGLLDTIHNRKPRP